MKREETEKGGWKLKCSEKQWNGRNDIKEGGKEGRKDINK